MKKAEVLKIIDEVMNNREIDSIRNAILAIRDKVIAYPDNFEGVAMSFKLATDNELCCTMPWYQGARYLNIDVIEKIDTGVRGSYCYSSEPFFVCWNEEWGSELDR